MWFLWTPAEAQLNSAVGPSHTMALTLMSWSSVRIVLEDCVGCRVGIAVRIAARLLDGLQRQDVVNIVRDRLHATKHGRTIKRLKECTSFNNGLKSLSLYGSYTLYHPGSCVQNSLISA